MAKNNSSNRKIWTQITWQSVLIVGVSIIVALLTNYLRKQPLPLISEPSTRNETSYIDEQLLIIPLQEAKELYMSGAALFIDARPEEFYKLGHIKGAISLPWEEFEKRYPKAFQGIPRDMTIITYCDGEHCDLSKDLALALIKRGYQNVYVLKNGWTVWKEANLPTESTSLTSTR